jgi:hypothetical protein
MVFSGSLVAEKNPSGHLGDTAYSTVSKPVSESLFQYVSVSLSFETVMSMEGDGYVFGTILVSRYPLEAHLSRALSQQGMEPKLG